MVGALVFSPDDKVIASSLDDNTVHFWDTRAWEKLGILKHCAEFSYLPFSRNSLYLKTDRGTLELPRLPWFTQTPEKIFKCLLQVNGW
jgi:WD40 repeat protein